MGPSCDYLITLFTQDFYLVPVALRAKDEVRLFKDKSGKRELWEQLPLHVQTAGCYGDYRDIVDVEKLFELHISK